ncbi:MAG TPA: hypothetical protein VH370_14775 [Humisphaera sp.]|jgi:hypothetical protein|nr:hypothetical protein [Humisphaera sp.]
MLSKRIGIFANYGLMLAFVAAAASCNSEKPVAPPTVTEVTTYTPGEAGGTIEETFTASAVVREINAKTRQVTLENEEGTKAIFTAPPEVRNFDQLKVGDHVKATLVQRVVVFVDSDAKASATHAELIATAPKGAKPGALVAEAYEITATVESIDTAARRAKLRFADGQRKTVSVRRGVDLSQYKVGDGVVIQVTAHLMVIAETP